MITLTLIKGDKYKSNTNSLSLFDPTNGHHDAYQRAQIQKYKYKHRKNCESCPTQVTWKIKYKCQICLSSLFLFDLSVLSVVCPGCSVFLVLSVLMIMMTMMTPWLPWWSWPGLHKLCYPTIRDRSTWSKFGAHGEHGNVFLFSNLGALWFSVSTWSLVSSG